MDDQRVYDAYVASRQSAALAVGVRVGLFDLLASGPRTAGEIAGRFAWSERAARCLLTALSAMGLLRRRDDRFEAADDAACYAVRGRPGSLWALIDLEVEHGLTAERLLAAMTADDASVYGGEDPWERHAVDPERARAFTSAMHAVSERPAAGLAEVVDLADGGRVLDVGGGSGAISIAIARRWKHAHCTVLDLPIVCEVARGFIAASDLESRVTAVPGDMFARSWPTGFDVVVLSQILHDWPVDTGRELLARAFAALPAGGRAWIHEKLVEDDEDAPLANALVHLDMLVWTRGQQYRFAELAALLDDAGFGDVRRRPTAGYWTLVEAVKP